MKTNKHIEYKVSNADYVHYEYRGFEYTKEFKKQFKQNGLNIKKVIDNYFDNGLDSIVIYFKDTVYRIELENNKIAVKSNDF